MSTGYPWPERRVTDLAAVERSIDNRLPVRWRNTRGEVREVAAPPESDPGTVERLQEALDMHAPTGVLSPMADVPRKPTDQERGEAMGNAIGWGVLALLVVISSAAAFGFLVR